MDELDPRFKIRAPLRCDGIGRLDCAEDLESGMRMAVRWLPLEANGSAAVEACEQLPVHPTLPRIRQIGQMGASAYVAMEFPDGNLLTTQAGEALPEASLIGITAQIADALATIHSQEVFHGEMSADSVLLVKSPSEKAFLWDMPLVIANRLTDRRGEERLMTQLVRTAPYLAPERARGGLATAESDVYALGAIICVAGGAGLPTADTTLGIVNAVVSAAWVPRVPKSIPEPLRSMLDRMISREPGDRPTAREVADLFMPPVASHPTLREMAAVGLPGAAQALPAGAAQVRPADVRPTAPAILDARPTAPSPAILDARPTAPSPAMPIIDAQIPSPVAPSMLEAKGADVALTDNVSVCQELRLAGAVLLSAEQAAQLTRPNRKAPLLMAAVMAVLVTVLLAMAIDLAHKAPVKAATQAAPAAREVDLSGAAPARAHSQVAVTAEAAAPLAAEDDLLSPLTPRAKKAAKRRASSHPSELSAQETAEDRAQDFGFLNEEPELKRPSF